MEQLSLLEGLDDREAAEQAADARQDQAKQLAYRSDRPPVSAESPGRQAGARSASLASNEQADPPAASNDQPAVSAPAIRLAIRPPVHPTIPPAPPTAEVQHLATALTNALDNGLYLGTSSWSFPGWSGLIYGAPTGKANLSRQGLPAYSQHPLLRSVGIDSGFYAPLDATRLKHWAKQVPAQFRFVVKAPALITDRYRRAARGRPVELNPGFLDPGLATEVAVRPYQQGLGAKAGILLWQIPPLSGTERKETRRFAEAIYRFLSRLPKGPTYAVELRDANLLTPDLAAALHHGGAVPGLALHPRLPPLPEQLALFADYAEDGPLMIRWLLRRNHRYDEARSEYAPFDRLCEPDPESRVQVAEAVMTVLAQQRPVFVIANNKAEGSAPLTLLELARLLLR